MLSSAEVDKVLIIVNRNSTDSVYPALLLASGARSHDIATDIIFTGSGLDAVAKDMDESVRGYLDEIKDAGGYVYADDSALEAAQLGHDDLWPGLKAVLPLEQFKHHATDHTQIVSF